LDNENHPERNQDPVPDGEAVIDPIADVDGDDQGEGGNGPPASAAMVRLGYVPSLVAPVPVSYRA
jgi:hypothetical protein